MTSWTKEELDAIGAAGELDIAVRREDGTLRRYATIWVVRVGDELYVRSYRGQAGAWYQAVQRNPEGRIRTAYLDAMLASGARETTLRLSAA